MRIKIRIPIPIDFEDGPEPIQIPELIIPSVNLKDIDWTPHLKPKPFQTIEETIFGSL